MIEATTEIEIAYEPYTNGEIEVTTRTTLTSGGNNVVTNGSDSIGPCDFSSSESVTSSSNSDSKGKSP